MPAEQGPTYSTEHPHEPEIPPAFDDEGRCLICVMLVRIENLEAELQVAQEREKELLRVIEQVQKYRDGLPEGIIFALQDLEDAQRTEEPSDDEGLEPIETSPLTEREPDL